MIQIEKVKELPEGWQAYLPLHLSAREPIQSYQKLRDKSSAIYLLSDEVPVAAFGLIPYTLLGRQLYLWSILFQPFFDCPIPYMVLLKKISSRFFEDTPLTCNVREEDLAARRFVEGFGFVPYLQQDGLIAFGRMP